MANNDYIWPSAKESNIKAILQVVMAFAICVDMQ